MGSSAPHQRQCVSGLPQRAPRRCVRPLASWRSSSGKRPHPSVSYSINRRDIGGAELGMLLASTRTTEMEGRELCRQNYSYWATEAGLRHAARLELALRRSVATVACFTTADVYDTASEPYGESSGGGGGAGGRAGSSSSSRKQPRPGAEVVLEEECALSASAHARQREQQQRTGSGGRAGDGWRDGHGGGVPHAGGARGKKDDPGSPPRRGIPDMDWNWLRPTAPSSAPAAPPSSSGASTSGSGSSSPSGFARAVPGAPAPKARKSLVGFARATGDNSLVATIYDVAVHPSVRGHGIGRRLVKLLVQQVQARAVYDIGLVTPAGAEGFWERCSFEDDREGSTFMTFLGHDSAASAPRSPTELLNDRSLVHWEAASQSESLRTLLEAKLAAACRGEAADGAAGVAGARSGRRGPGEGAWPMPGRSRMWFLNGGAFGSRPGVEDDGDLEDFES